MIVYDTVKNSGKDKRTMKILRAKKNKKEWIYRSIAVILFMVTIVGFIGVVQYSNAVDDFSKSQPVLLMGTVILTVTLFAGFGMYAKASYIHNYESLNVFAIDDTGMLYRVFFTKTDVGAGQYNYMPATTAGKAAFIVNSAKTISNIQEQADFLKSDVLSEYVKGILDGTMEMSQFVRIHPIENPKLMKQDKSRAEFFYTVGKHKQLQKAELYSSHEGYREIMEWLKSHETSCDYKGKKEGECLEHLF